MSPESILKRAGFEVTSNSIGVPRWGYTQQISERYERFQKFQQAVFENAQGGTETLTLHLLAFHGVDPTSIHRLSNLDLTRYTSSFGQVLEITRNGNLIERVLLCHVTAAVEPRWAIELVATQDWLTKHYARKGNSLDETLLELRCDQLAWAQVHLPPAIFAHTAGLIPCTPLSRDTWVRECSGMVPRNAGEYEDCTLHTSVDLILDQLEVGGSQADGSNFLTRALSGLSNLANESDRERRERWIKHLIQLAPQAIQYSKATTIVLGWCANTIESGTVKKGNAADLDTRRRYVLAAAHGLLKGIQVLSENPRYWNATARVRTYEEILQAAAGKDFPALSAAIASFQAYLRDEFDVPVLLFRTNGLRPEQQVRAQYVTETEVQRVSQWIGELFIDDHALGDRTAALLWMCYDAPFRVSEVLALTKNCVRKLVSDGFEIVVASSAENTLKTDAAARRLWVQDPRAVDALDTLIASRDREGWASQDLLFAHGLDGNNVYRKAALRRSLLRLLKAATGDEKMTIHALRHSWVTRSLLEGFASSSISPIPVLASKVAQTGHAALHTSMTSYFHMPEVVLRLHLDVAFLAETQVTSRSAEPYCRMNAAALRQRALRADRSMNEVVWATAMRRAEALCVPPPDLSGWTIPVCPRIETRSPVQQTPRLVLQFLLLVEKGAKPAALAPRFGFCDAFADEILAEARLLIGELQRSSYHRNRKIDDPKRSLGKVTFAKALQPKYKGLLQWMEDGNCNSPTARLATEAWQMIRNRYGYLDMCHERAADLLRLLNMAGIEIHQLSVRAQNDDEVNGVAKFQLRAGLAQKSFHTAFGISLPKIQPAPKHATRCGAYLVWAGQEGADLRGLDAILLSMKVYFNLQGRQIDSTN